MTTAPNPTRILRPACAVAALATLALAPGLGSSGRLSYHEALVAQAAREMLASGDAVVPTLGGLPWLEKPPLAVWLAAFTGKAAGGVSEASARLPSALAAAALALAVAGFAARRFGPGVGLLAGLIQATTAWAVTRGRLAEADMLLAAIVTATLLAFDRLRSTTEEARPGLPWARWAFFAGLGLTALAKGIGFGAALVLAVVPLTLLLDRDRAAWRRLAYTPGWALAALVALAWPVLAACRHPSALSLWALHVTDRLADEPRHFIGQSWPAYGVAVLGSLLPWTPLALAGAARSLPRALAPSGRFGGDRFLWAWAVAPLALLSLATVKQAHYAIYALPPCSVWAAFGACRLGARLQARGHSVARLRAAALLGFAGLGLAYGAGFAALGPWLDTRGVEWAFYETAARKLGPGEPLALLYNVPEWDRLPYETPFGPVPHDWAVRLFYLHRETPAPCRFGTDDLARRPVGRADARTFAVIGRDADRPGLERLGRVEALAEGPRRRFDRIYKLYRVTPEPVPGLASRPERPGTPR